MPSLRHVHVLVVDDNVGSRTILTLGLELEGAIVYVAPSAPEAIVTLATVLPDVIVTDMTMPPMDGYELIGHVKSSIAWRHIPVIAVTGFGDIHQERDVRAAGFVDYFVKPVNLAALTASIVRVTKAR